MKRQAVKRLAGAALAAVCLFLVGQGPAEGWAAFGNRVALLAVGLQRPEGGAVVLSQRLDAAAAGAVTENPIPSVSVPTVSAPVTEPEEPVSAAATQTATPAAAVTAPQKAADAGTVLEQTVSTGSDFVQGVAVRNRSGKAFDLAKELKIQPKIDIKEKSDRPQVLIVHTHTTEGYLTYDTGFFNPSDVERTNDQSRNICAAGEAIAEKLRAAGIETVHDTTIHDSPQYTGAYARSEATVKAALKKHPTVQVVLDIHRDAILPGNNTHVKPTATVNGKKAAQMMIIAGVVSTKALPHPNWQENFHFALQLQQSLANSYPNLMRPLSLVASRYNQHLANGYLLVEIGSDVNTVSEAVYSGELLGKTLAEVLLKG